MPYRRSYQHTKLHRVISKLHNSHREKPYKIKHDLGFYSACYLLHAGFLLGLFFDPEDGGNMLLRKAGWLSTDLHGAISQKSKLLKTPLLNKSQLKIFNF
jgi:hypothetical protein